jgi:hypothetical protein
MSSLRQYSFIFTSSPTIQLNAQSKDVASVNIYEKLNIYMEVQFEIHISVLSQVPILHVIQK